MPADPLPAARTAGTGRATLTVMLGIGASRVFGLVREQVVAYYFGRAAAYSAFVAAYKVPNLVRVLLGEGNLSASLIPVLARSMRSGDPTEARRVARGVLGLLLVVVGAVTVAGMALARPLSWLVAPGFDPGLRLLVERLIVLLFPTVAFLVVGAWCMGVLHAHRRFFWPNFAPVFWSLASAGALIAFVGRTSLEPVYVLAWGVVAGSLLQVLVELGATRSVLGTVAPGTGWKDPAVGRVVALFLPMMVGTGVAQISSLVDIQIATFLGDASVATLAYAQRIYTLPLSLFGVAVAQVALPALAHEAAGPGTGEGEPRPEALRDELSRSWQRMAFLILPSTVGLVAFGRPAVSLLFERGRFQAADTTAVSWVLAAYAAGLLAYGSARLLATAFYAFHDTRTPVRIGVLALAVNVVLGVGLAWLMGTPGIALATALAAVLSAGLLARALRRRMGAVLTPAGRTGGWRMALAAALAAGAGALPYIWLLGRWDGWGLGSRIGGTAALYGGVALIYFAASRGLGSGPAPRLAGRSRSSR